MAGEEQGHEDGPNEGAGDDYDPDQPFEAPGGAMTTPGLEEAGWGELADAVSSHGEIPDDLDVDGDQPTDAGSEGPDGREEMMDAWRVAQREVGFPTPEEEGRGAGEPIIDVRGLDHGEEPGIDLTGMDHLPPPKEDE